MSKVQVVYNNDCQTDVIKVFTDMTYNEAVEATDELDKKERLGSYNIQEFDSIEEAMNYFIVENIGYMGNIA